MDKNVLTINCCLLTFALKMGKIFQFQWHLLLCLTFEEIFGKSIYNLKLLPQSCESPCTSPLSPSSFMFRRSGTGCSISLIWSRRQTTNTAWASSQPVSKPASYEASPSAPSLQIQRRACRKYHCTHECHTHTHKNTRGALHKGNDRSIECVVRWPLSVYSQLCLVEFSGYSRSLLLCSVVGGSVGWLLLFPLIMGVGTGYRPTGYTINAYTDSSHPLA